MQANDFLRATTYLDEDWETDVPPTQPIASSTSGGFIPANEAGDSAISGADLPSESEAKCTAEDNGDLISCSVCLEELPKSKLKQHYGCSCILCSDCLTVSL